ncbi:MAG TPA: hypothetical protein VHB21_26555 [Minicystis sp.]|nr:hypothetical protein [Minicystis sp.]
MRLIGLAPFAAAVAAVVLSAAPSPADNAHPWERPPGPIAGRWKTTCDFTADMVVEISVNGKHAVGKIVALGQGGKRGYHEGDDVLQLDANDFGHWVGKLRWRSVAGMERQDPIHFVATGDTLDAIMTTDECYRKMPRVK